LLQTVATDVFDFFLFSFYIRLKQLEDPFYGQKLNFSGEFTGKIVAIGSGHFRDPPQGQMAKKLFFVSFSQETSWQYGGLRKWPLWGPSLRPNGQKFSFVRAARTFSKNNRFAIKE
jgi:hypothetical protein